MVREITEPLINKNKIPRDYQTQGPDEEERRLGASLASEHGLAALCRVIFNSNEFVVIE